MEYPAETLRALLESNWTLEEEKVGASDVKFTRFDWNIESTPFQPHVIVLLTGFRRMQPAENVLHEFTFVVRAVLWPKTLPKMEEVQALHWKMVEHIKHIIENADKPSGWESVGYIDTGVNVGEPLALLPEQFAFNLAVKSTIAWSV